MNNFNSQSPNAPRFSEVEVNTILNKLTELNYFKFTETKNLGIVKERMNEHIQYGTISSFGENEKGEYLSLDKRSYLTDQEDLAEGSIGQAIKQMLPILEKEGVVISSINDRAVKYPIL